MSFFFFFNDTATTEIYTLSLHDALPIWSRAAPGRNTGFMWLRLMPSTTSGSRAHSVTDWDAPLRASRSASAVPQAPPPTTAILDRKSTRLNSSHLVISYAVFCLKKKKTKSTVSTTHTKDTQ